jgi:hypothetical protein
LWEVKGLGSGRVVGNSEVIAEPDLSGGKLENMEDPSIACPEYPQFMVK